jgi:hypothetical protein
MSYHQHLVFVTDGSSHHSNFRVACSCGHVSNVASLSDEFAARCALEHVINANKTENEYEEDPE